MASMPAAGIFLGINWLISERATI